MMFTKESLLLLAAAVAVQASPVPKPQGVTGLFSPSAAIPTGCKASYSGLFAIAAVKASGVATPSSINTNTARMVKRASATASIVTAASDGQIVPASSTVAVITQISDAQPQVPSTTKLSSHSSMWHTAMSQIVDGQVQAYYTVMAVTQISDAQIQAPKVTTVAPVSQISDAQPQVSVSKTQTSSVAVVTQMSDAQPGVSSALTASPVTQLSDAQPGATSATSASSAASASVSMVACKTNSTLELDLSNGYLKDGKGRIGYIAANFQFQFDAGVPQTGAIYTAGFSVCDNGTLALGGSAIFWQCLSGTFYNLYDRYWAPQCEPVFLRVVGLKDC